jgi:uncharacterized protein
MRIAITGSSGLVGSAVIPVLKSNGHQVIRLVRKGDKLKTDEVAWIPERGLTSPEKLEGIDAVIHLAGRSIAAGRWTKTEKERIRNSRVDATQRLVAQLVQLKQPPSTFICASAVGIYGDCGDRVVDESSPIGDDFLAKVARDWEKACYPTGPIEPTFSRVLHARLGLVLDEQGGALAKMLPLFRFWLGGRLGNGNQYWSWISLADVVRGLYWMLETPTAAGPYNLVAPHPVTNSQFTAALAKTLRRPALLPAPRFALQVLMGEMADALLFTSCRVKPKNLLSDGFAFQHPELEVFLMETLAGQPLASSGPSM